MLIYKIQFQNGAHLMLIDWGKKKVGEGGGREWTSSIFRINGLDCTVFLRLHPCELRVCRLFEDGTRCFIMHHSTS